MKINLEPDRRGLKFHYKKYEILVIATSGQLHRIYVNDVLLPMPLDYLKTLLERLDEIYEYIQILRDLSYYTKSRWIYNLLNNPLPPELIKKLELGIKISRGKKYGRS